LKKLEHLSEIYNFYDAFIVDLWGVIHNGIKLNSGAMEVVKNLTKNNKRITFLSNAPRPNESVVKFLRKLNMKEEYLKNVLTSGEAAVKSLNDNKFGVKFFHLGPKKDISLFMELEKNKTTLEKSEFILCTGLFDEYENDLNYYKKLLKDYISKKLICTNPDLMVHRGGKKEHCAGAVAEIFKFLGGEVVYFGKPYKEVYDLCLNKNEKTFIIGDNLNTDIKGANNLNLDSLFITGGIHRSEYKNENDLEILLKQYKVTTQYFQQNLSW